MKFQQETGMSMTAGCLPMAVNFLVLFGLIEVVYRPLQYILRVPKELIDKAVELANSALGMNLMANNFTVQNDIINAVKSSPDVFPVCSARTRSPASAILTLCSWASTFPGCPILLLTRPA